MITKKIVGTLMLGLSVLTMAILLQMSKIAYYAYLASPIADYTKTEYDFLNQPAVSIVVICVIVSCILIFYDKISGWKKKLQ